MVLHFTSIAISMIVRVPEKSIERHVVASPTVVTTEMVRKILEYENIHHMGYFPALDFYIAKGCFDNDLVEALHNISWVVTNMARNEIKIRMRPVFSSIKFESIQTLAHTLPSVRPTDPNKHDKLLEHLSPTTVKINLNASLIQKIVDNESAQSLASNMIYRWLEEAFLTVKVTSCTVIN